MNKQMKTAMAAMLTIGTLPMMAQQSETKVVKVAPGQTKTTVIHRKNGATDTIVSEGASTGAHKKHVVAHKKRVVVHHEPVESATARELRELREKQAAQQAEIDQLKASGAAKDAALAQAESDARGAEAQAQTATSAAQNVNASVQSNTAAVNALKSNVSDLQTTNAGLATTIVQNKVELTEKIDNPLVIHYKNVRITPVGFLAFEGVYRQRSINSDINTPFNNTPFPGSNEGHISELNFTARQSRLAALVEGDVKDKYKLSGYVETDFLSTSLTSNSNQSDSYSLRVRQAWAKAETKGGFAVTGGQTWSLVTENGKSTDARTEKLPNTIDTSYMVGYSWIRQPTIRIQQKIGHPVFGAGFTMAMSLEQAQTQLGTAANAPTNYIFGGPGTGGGLFNNTATYANNKAPDVVTKFAFDAKHFHFEFGGLARFFRVEYNPLVAGTANTIQGNGIIAKNTKVGGGVFGSIRVPSKYFEMSLEGMGGPGVARYGAAQLGDVTVRPDGTLEPIKNYHGLAEVIGHVTPKFDVYGYFGADYNQRTTYVGPTGLLVGYGVRNANDSGCYALTLGVATTVGAPTTVGSCASPTKLIEEGMFGMTYRVVNSPKLGRLQYQATYSYLNKDTWSGILNTTTGVTGHGNATNNMIHVSMRYYLP